jgi:peptidoglycan/LPS O-acetylase OafA/YrhL
MKNRSVPSFTRPSEKSGHIIQLDGVRGLAIASVFLHHAFHVKLLWMGVDLFFVLSGFLITGILLKAKDQTFGSYTGIFYARRARRILPAYFVILAISTVMFGPSWMRYWYLYLGGMNFIPPLHLTGLDTLPLWSLAVEEQFYLIWPIAVYYLSRKHLKVCAIALLAIAPTLRFFCTPLFALHWAVYMLVPFRMDTLAMGALIAIVWPDFKTKNQSSRFKTRIAGECIAVMLAAFATLGFLSRNGLTTNSNTRIANLAVYESTLMIVTGVFVIALIGIGNGFFSFSPLRLLGRISYSVYLFHLTAIYLAPSNNIPIAAAITILYATAMWFLVEKPILNWKPKPKRHPIPSGM